MITTFDASYEAPALSGGEPDGAFGLVELDVSGELHFVEMQRRRLIRRRNHTEWRWYGAYDVEHPHGGESARIRVRQLRALTA